MGEISSDIQEGLLCQECGQYMEDFQYTGYPRTCCDCNFPGYMYINEWESLKVGQKVWLYGFSDGKPHLYGPHHVHNISTHELMNIKQKRTFFNNKDVMVIKL